MHRFFFLEVVWSHCPSPLVGVVTLNDCTKDPAHPEHVTASLLGLGSKKRLPGYRRAGQRLLETSAIETQSTSLLILLISNTAHS